MKPYRQVLGAILLLASSDPSVARRERTELEKALKKEGDTDFAARRAKALEPYAGAPDPVAALLVDTNTPVVDVPAMTKVLNETAQLLLKGWTGKPVPVQVIVRAEMREYAMVHATGVIQVSAGLIEKFGSLNTVAAVIAHEIGHLIAGDPGRRERFDRVFTTAAGLAASGGIYAEIGAQKPFAGSGQQQIKLTPKMEDQLVAGFATQALVSDSLAPALDAGDEYDADRLGADLMAQSPFEAYGGNDAFLGTLARAEAAPGDRLNAAAGLLKGLMAARLGARAGTMGEGGQTGMGIGIIFAQAGIDEVAKRAARKTGSEADAQKRRDRFAAYDKAWPGDPENGLPTGNPKHPDYVRLTAAFNAARASKPWKDALQSVKASDQLVTALVARSDQVAARNSGQSEVVRQAPPLPPLKSLAETPAVPPAIWAKGVVAKLTGQTVEATRVLEAGAKHPLLPRDAHHQLGSIHLARGNPKALKLVIDRGVARAGRDTGFLDLKVGLARLEGRTADAETLAARCLTEGGGLTYANCTAVLGYDPACTAKTPEGKSAMLAATTRKGFGDLLKSGINLAGLAGQSQPTTPGCPPAA